MYSRFSMLCCPVYVEVLPWVDAPSMDCYQNVFQKLVLSKNGSEGLIRETSHNKFLVLGTKGFFPGVKRPEREADHSRSYSAEVKECEELYRPSPNTPSWRGTQLKEKKKAQEPG
jgi:hypothetical protein